MFELQGVSKIYGTAVAIHPLDLHVERGQTTVLIGPSGCGKSTLIRMMVGLIRPTTGDVLFQGHPVTPENVTTLRRQMGYVIQEGGLFDHLTAGRNVTLMARYLGQPRSEIEQRLHSLAKLVRLPIDLLDHYPLELSGGQRQRVSLMRALMLDPAVLLLDEPMGALDPMVRHDLQTDLKQIFRELKKTVVLVTHDIGEAAFLGDTVVLLREGRIVQRGTMARLLHQPADEFVTRFINAQRSPVELMGVGE